MFRAALISICIICSTVSAGTPVYEDFKLLASDGASGDQFGVSVAVDGETVVTGANSDNDNGVYSGSAYVYRFDGSSWIETKLLASDGGGNDNFGFSVAVDDETVVVGALTDEYGLFSGSAYVYRFDGSSWIETKLFPSDEGTLRDFFGWSVAVDGETVVAGAYNDDDNGTDSGSTYVYRFDGSSWIETKLLASDGAEDDRFGFSVAVDGETVVVGAYRDDDNGTDSGSTYVYRFDGSSWIETKLLASDGAEDDRFGFSVAVDGETVVVGAYRDDDNGSDSGSTYVYRFDGSSWIETKLLASDGAEDDRFGWSVAVDGETVVAGAYRDDDNGSDSGSTYVYRFDGSSWIETKLLASDGAEDDRFGWSVAVDGETVVAGAYQGGDNGTDSGSAYIYQFDGSDCPDINGDGYVNVSDLLVVIDQWGLTDSPADVNQDGIVDVSDLLIVVGNWGPCE